MTTRMQTIGLSLAVLLATGCNADRWRPAPALPASWTASNPCEQLHPVRNVHPTYPQAAAANQRQGWVALKYDVAASGDVFSVRVVAANPEGVFDDASAAALTQWHYRPLQHPVSNCTRVYVYALDPTRPPVPKADDASFAAFEEIQPR